MPAVGRSLSTSAAADTATRATSAPVMMMRLAFCEAMRFSAVRCAESISNNGGEEKQPPAQAARVATQSDGLPPMTLPLATANNYNAGEGERPGPPSVGAWPRVTVDQPRCREKLIESAS